MKRSFGKLLGGGEAFLYTITSGQMTAEISDYGATLVRLFVPDKSGEIADVVLGFDDPNAYTTSGSFFGATVGRNANRIKGGVFTLNGKRYEFPKNDNGLNNHHSGPNFFKDRLWTVAYVESDAICLSLNSPDGDQGFPGNATIRVTYTLENGNTLRVTYDAVCDKDTVFNMTHHSYFNLAGHHKPEKAMDQLLSMSARYFTPAGKDNVPTGEMRSVEGTPMDFRKPKAVGKDISQPYEALELQGGYDHNFEVFTNPCAILSDPVSGRTMAISTDCPGIHLYAGNFLDPEMGKDGVRYCRRGGVALETQFYPDALNHPQWDQPITRAGERYHSETKYKFG